MMRRLFCGLLFPLLLLCTLANGEDYLPPSLAFKPTARALDGQTIEVRDFGINAQPQLVMPRPGTAKIQLEQYDALAIPDPFDGTEPAGTRTVP